MKLKHITKRAVTLLLAVVLLTGCLITHAANNETAQEAGSIPDPLISTTSNMGLIWSLFQGRPCIGIMFAHLRSAIIKTRLIVIPITIKEESACL